MEFRYRGILYEITQGLNADVWRWQVRVGNPAMLRIGEAATEMQADINVKSIIDRSLTLHHQKPD